MLSMKRLVLTGTLIISLLLTAFTSVVSADTITPSHVQEFMDAKGALEAARKAEGEKYAPSYLKQAVDFVTNAESARSIPDAEAFSRSSRLARAYAELAKASAELNADLEKLTEIREALAKAKSDIDLLKK